MMQTRRKEGFIKRLSRKWVRKDQNILQGQTFISRWLSSWDDVNKTVDAFTLEKTKRLAPQEAARNFSLLVRKYRWHLSQPVSRIEQVELLCIGAFLLLSSQSLWQKNWKKKYSLSEQLEKKATISLKKNGENWDEKRIISCHRWLVEIHFAFFKIEALNKNRSLLLKRIQSASANGMLETNEWDRLIQIALNSPISGNQLFELAIKYYSYRGECSGEFTDQLENILKKMLLKQSKLGKDKRCFWLRKLHLAAPWMGWPVLNLVKIEIDNQGYEGADLKLTALHPILEKQNEKTETSFLLGQSKYFSGKYELADQYFNEALEGGADVSAIHEFIGVSKANAGNLNDALEHIGQALENSPADLYLLKQKGNILLALNRYTEAKELFSVLMKGHSNDSELLYGLAKIAEAEGDHAAAEKLLFDITTQDPEHTDAQCSLSAMFIARKEFDRGRSILEALLEQIPDHLPSQIELGICLIRSGIEISDTETVETGLDILSRCYQNKVEDQRVAYWLGRACADLNEFEKCLMYWTGLRASLADTRLLDPDIRTIKLIVAQNKVTNKEYHEALKLLQDLNNDKEEYSKKEIEELTCEVRLQLAHIAMEKTEFEEAGNQINEVLFIQPERAHAHLLALIKKYYAGNLTPDQIEQAIQTMADGPERYLATFLSAIFAQEIPTGVPFLSSGVDEMIAEEEFSTYLENSQYLSSFLNVLDAIGNQDVPLEEKQIKLQKIIEQLEDDLNIRGLDEIQFSWWLAGAIQNCNCTLEFQKANNRNKEKIKQEHNTVFEMINGFLNVSSKDSVQAGLEHLESLLSRLPVELRVYWRKAWCFVGYQALKKANRDPRQLQLAQHAFSNAIQDKETA